MNISKNTCKELRTDLASALKEIEEKYGFTIDVGNMRYDNTSVECKIKFARLRTGIKSKEEQDFLDFCEAYGLEKFHLGIEFVADDGCRHKIVGLSRTRRTYPIITRNISKKGPGTEGTNCFTPRAVLSCIS